MLTEHWRKLHLSILFRAVINNLEQKLSRIFVTFTKDITMEKVVILNKDLSAKAIIKILHEKGIKHTHTHTHTGKEKTNK